MSQGTLLHVADGMLTAIPLVVKSAMIEPGKASPLFRPGVRGNNVSSRQQYKVAPDGHFLINVTSDGVRNY